MRHRSWLPIHMRTTTALGRQSLKAVRLLVIASMIYSLFLPGSLQRANAQDGELPYIVASEAGDWFWTSGFAPGGDLALSIYESAESEIPLWSGARTADAGGFVIIGFEDHNIDLLPGNEVRVSDSAHEKRVVLETITMEVFDTENEIMSGTAPAGREVSAAAGPQDWQERIMVVADPLTGAWLADFKTIGFDITEDMRPWSSAAIFDADGDANEGSTPPPPPNPWFTVFPKWEFVEGWNWPYGAVVHMEIDDPGTAESPDYQQDETVGIHPGDPNQNTLWVSFSLADDYDVKTGDVVTLSDGETTRVHTVQNLSVTGIDPDENTVSGTADGDTQLYVWPHDGWFEPLQPIADAGGAWQVDFDDVGYDLQRGASGRAEIRDEFNNTTSVDWYVPNPRIVYRYNQYVVAEQFTPGAEITLWFYESQASPETLFEISRTADENGHVNIPVWEHPFEFVPGNYVVASDGTTTKDLVLEPVATEVYDPELDLMAGTAAPGEFLYVYVQNDSQYCYLELTADENGEWTADFSAQSCDVTGDMWGAAQVFDEDGDVSEAAVLQTPTGYHDYDSGDVPNWACNAGGWAIDPDDPYENVNVRILVDGVQVGDEITANNYRPDLESAWNDGGGGCPGGTCAFEVSLWDSITHYELHEVTVEAQDLQSGEWYPLNNTPKPLTCRTYDIYLYNPQTAETSQITTLTDSNEFNPRWSPDGQKIVHDRWYLDSISHGVYITEVKTGVSSPLAGAEGGSYPTWSPTGRWIAFDRGADEDFRLFIVPPTGGEPRLVIEDAFMATWAPHGRRLAYHQPSDGSIRTADLNGGNVTLVAERGNGPAWAPNGQWIAYEMDGDIWKVRVDLNGNPLGGPIQLTTGPTWEGRPSWSPDSKTIVYHAGLSRDTDLWTIPAGGGMPTWLTGAPEFGDYDPNYSNNGRSIAYASFSPDGQAPRHWASSFTRDLPGGYWAEGGHSYHFDLGGQDELTFNVSGDAPLYDGYVLLRPWGQLAKTGDGCESIDTLHPDQPTRFHIGWVTDEALTYAEALASLEIMPANVYWDDGLSADLVRHEIFPRASQVDWPQYTCAFTTLDLSLTNQAALSGDLYGMSADSTIFLPNIMFKP